MIQPYRKKVEWLLAAIYIFTPFVRINGESLFRFDVPTLKLYVFGVGLWMQEFFIVLLATLFLVALFLFLTFVFGRVWCGWLCPQTVFTDLTEFIEKLRKKSFVTKVAGHLFLLVLSLILGFISVCYFISPYEAIPQAMNWQLGTVPAVATLVLGLITYLNLAFMRKTFCATICPYAKIQGIITDDKSLIIQMNPEREDECIDCKQCVRICPTGVDIRGGMQVSCIMCARCVDACTTVMGRKNKTGLIQYMYGKSGFPQKSVLTRPVAIIFGLATVVFLSALIYTGSNRTSFDYTILPHPMEPRMTKEGDTMNAYILSIKNKAKDELELSFKLRKEQGVELSHNITDTLTMPGGVVDKFPLFVRSKGKLANDLQLELQLCKAGTTPEATEECVTKTVFFNKALTN